MSEIKSVAANVVQDSGQDRVSAADVDGVPGVPAGEPYTVAAWVDVAPVMAPSDPGYVVAWWAEAMSTEYWFNRKQTATPAQAALVFCRVNPRDFRVTEQYRAEEVAETSLDELTVRDAATGKVTGRKTLAEAYRELRFAFEAVHQAKPAPGRTMYQWLEIAQRRGLTYHPWVDAWRKAVEQIARESGSHITTGDCLAVIAAMLETIKETRDISQSKVIEEIIDADLVKGLRKVTLNKVFAAANRGDADESLSAACRRCVKVLLSVLELNDPTGPADRAAVIQAISGRRPNLSTTKILEVLAAS
ncbi:hypothetical protein [Paraburkholderia sp. EG304]|uniref:hypothetical protein n=1 Tax=Paraburkholderia sp. EG304 TaxID=3237015 RepID=UPI00397E6590